MKNIAVLLMAGVSNRFKNKTPKQFIKINNEYLFIYTLKMFLKINELDEIILVVHEQYVQKVKKILKQKNILENKISIVLGKNSRANSLLNATKYVCNKYKKEKAKIISHDIARCFIQSNLINKHLKQKLQNKQMLNTLLPLSDSIIKKTGMQYQLLNRDDIYLIQTPQTFIAKDLLIAYQNNQDIWNNFNDICSFGITCGFDIKDIQGELSNIKITYKEDLKYFNLYKLN